MGRLLVCLFFVLCTALLSTNAALPQHDAEIRRVAAQYHGVFRNKPYNSTEFYEALDYLIKYMPRADRRALSVHQLTVSVDFALRTRYEMPWGKSIPWAVFLNDVVPYATLAEPRDNWRVMFHDYFRNVVKGIDGMVDAVQTMNQKAWGMRYPAIFFAPDLGGVRYSPFQVLRAGNSSCTGLSVYFTMALRSIGIPARVAGVPHWNLGPKQCPHGEHSAACGNHDWIEAFVDGGWSFVDELGDPKLNTSWFYPGNAKTMIPGTTNHSIFATSWAPADVSQTNRYDPLAFPRGHFPMVWDWTNRQVPAFDVTQRYLSMKP